MADKDAPLSPPPSSGADGAPNSSALPPPPPPQQQQQPAPQPSAGGSFPPPSGYGPHQRPHQQAPPHQQPHPSQPYGVAPPHQPHQPLQPHAPPSYYAQHPPQGHPQQPPRYYDRYDPRQPHPYEASPRHYESPHHAPYHREQFAYGNGRAPAHPLSGAPGHPSHGPPQHSQGAHPHAPQMRACYPQPRGGLAPSKSGAFHRYQPQNRWPAAPSQGVGRGPMQPGVQSPRLAPVQPEMKQTQTHAETPQPPITPSMHVKQDAQEEGAVVADHGNEKVESSEQEKKEVKEHGVKEDDEVLDEAIVVPQVPVPAPAEASTQAAPQAENKDVVTAQGLESAVDKSEPKEANPMETQAPNLPRSTLEPLSTKRPRSEPNVDDVTPKAYNHHHHSGFFPAHGPPHQAPHGSHPPPHHQMYHTQPTKRTKHEEYYPKYYEPHPPKQPYAQHAGVLRPIRSPSHRRSFSLESESRQDKPARYEDDSHRYRPASYSPSSLTSRRSFDFYRREEDASLLRSLSWTNDIGRSRSMSWEVPPALSLIGSFGQLNNDSLRNEDDVEDEDLPPLPASLPGIGNEAKGFPLAPRPMNKMLDSRERMPTREERMPHPPREMEYYGVDRGPAMRDPRDARDPRQYYLRDRYYDERERYEDTWYHKADGCKRYEERRGRNEMDMVDRRDPYDSRRYRRYEDERHQHRSPPPLARDAYFAYPNDTPGGLSSRSFDSRSLGDMEEPMNSLLYRPSFSWERGLEMPLDYDQPVRNNVLVQLKDQQKIMKALAMRNEIRTIGNPQSAIGLILLLAMPNDRHCLSETLCIVRNNIEVFTATAQDIDAPAPGRKRPVQVGQVGLRCVYCRMCPNNRVKRAACFPSSTKRIYRAVIDMKLDHFPYCPYIPQGLKNRLEELSAGSARSTGMTVQYFVMSAKDLGMVEMDEGVYIDLKRVGKEQVEAHIGAYPQQMLPPSLPNHMMAPQGAVMSPIEMDPYTKSFKVPLGLEEDSNFLSPLRCFLRRNVCAFTASAKDIAVRTPTTFSVRIGQVGVGCMHCLSVPAKKRSNRAVCFPFTISRIYQSVADIQRFHLGECKMMPPEVRAEFVSLQSDSTKGSRGLATRTYWIDAGRKLGLADGPNGMYFSRDPTLPPPSEEKSLDILAQVATNAKTNFKPLVTLEDKPTIAEFLYLVVEQLQPCRFTDADRNKRRSKNLGSIGVECKHCAGKIDSRKFFWSSVSAAESNFVSVHSHMMDCKYISREMKDELARLKALRREQTNKLKSGSQKAFFTRVWNRLHDPANLEDGAKSAPPAMKSDEAPLSSSLPIDSSALKSIEHDDTFENLVLPSGGSHEELRALLESKSTLSSMPSIEEVGRPNEMEAIGSAPDINKADTDIKMGSSSDSAIAIKNSLSSVAHDLSAVTVHSKEVELDTTVCHI